MSSLESLPPRAFHPTTNSTPFPSRPFLHSFSPASTQATPPELKKLEGVWRQLRRTHFSPPVKDKGKGRELQLDDKENRSWESRETSSPAEDHREGLKIGGESSRAAYGWTAEAGRGLRVEGGRGGAQVQQLRPPRFRTSVPPGPQASTSSQSLNPATSRIPSASSAMSSDLGTHRTTSYGFKPSPPPAPHLKPRSPSPPLAGSTKVPSPPYPHHIRFAHPSPPPRTRSPSPEPQQPPPDDASPPSPFSPLYTAHLPPSHQPLKHGFVLINPPSSVRLVLRGQRWELSGDGEQLSFWPTLVNPTQQPLQVFTAPFDDLLLPPRIITNDGIAMLKLHRKRLTFLRTYIATMRSDAVFCSIPLPPFQASSSLHHSLLLQIHANPPHPSLTLTSSSSPKIVVRWISNETSSRGRWEIRLGDGGRDEAGGGGHETGELKEDERGTLLEDARRVWEVLDRLRKGGVEVGVWRAWVEGGGAERGLG